MRSPVDYDSEKGEMKLKDGISINILHFIKQVILRKEISENGKLKTDGIRQIIWDMKVWQQR